MANSPTNVSQAKPAIGGSVSYGALSVTLPTDATTALAAGFKNVGYITTDGVVNSRSMDSSTTKAWGGDTVITTTSPSNETFKFTLMEVLNPDVLKLVHGDANVTGVLDTGITVKTNSDTLEDRAFVIDMILKGGVLKRIVIPHGTITAIDDVTYKDDTPIGYGVTITATPDDSGVTKYEYIQKKTAAAEGEK